MNMFNLGEHILYLANTHKGYIRNNHLQIVIYYTIKDYIQDHGINDYIKSIYDKPLIVSKYDIAHLNSQIIKNHIHSVNKIRRNGYYDNQFKPFDNYILHYVFEDPFDNYPGEQGTRTKFWNSCVPSGKFIDYIDDRSDEDKERHVQHAKESILYKGPYDAFRKDFSHKINEWSIYELSSLI